MDAEQRPKASLSNGRNAGTSGLPDDTFGRLVRFSVPNGPSKREDHVMKTTAALRRELASQLYITGEVKYGTKEKQCWTDYGGRTKCVSGRQYKVDERIVQGSIIPEMNWDGFGWGETVRLQGTRVVAVDDKPTRQRIYDAGSELVEAQVKMSKRNCPLGRDPVTLRCLPPFVVPRGHKIPTDKELIEKAAESYLEQYRNSLAARDIVNGLASLLETATAPAKPDASPFALSSQYLPWF